MNKFFSADHRADNWTVSFWVKAFSTYNPVFCARTGPVTRELIRVDASDIVYIGNSANIYTRTAPNNWEHIVATKDSSGVSVYLNGTQIISNAASPNLLNRNVEHNLVCQDGTDTNSESTDATGYVSDYYFIDGSVLPPTTFGKNFEAGWGPLDSSVVLDNIGAKTSPYDTRPNTDKNWTSLATGSAITGTTLANAFDGNLSNYVRPNNGQTIVWDNIGVEGTIEIFGYKGSNTVNEAEQHISK